MRVHQIYGEAEFVGCGRPLIRDDKRLLHLRPFIAGVLDTFGQLVRILMYELIVQEEQALRRHVSGIAPFGGKRRNRQIKDGLKIVWEYPADVPIQSAPS